MGIASLSDYRKEFKFHINRGLCGLSCNVILKGRRKFDFDVFLPSIGCNLQRKHVWTLEQKRELIFSIIKGVNIGKITLIQHETKDDTIYQVIDGKQRLSAIIDFIFGVFEIILCDGVSYTYFNLPKDIKQEITLFDIISDIGYSYHDRPITDKEKIEWFELINFTGTPQDKEHLNKLKNGKDNHNNSDGIL